METFKEFFIEATKKAPVKKTAAKKVAPKPKTKPKGASKPTPKKPTAKKQATKPVKKVAPKKPSTKSKPVVKKPAKPIAKNLSRRPAPKAVASPKPKPVPIKNKPAPAVSVSQKVKNDLENAIEQIRNVPNDQFSVNNAQSNRKLINDIFIKNKLDSNPAYKNALNLFNKKTLGTLKAIATKKKNGIDQYKDSFDDIVDALQLNVGFYQPEAAPEQENEQQVVDPTKLFQSTVAELKQLLNKDNPNKFKILFSSMLNNASIGSIT